MRPNYVAHKLQRSDYCANIAAGLMVAQFAKYLRQLPIEPDRPALDLFLDYIQKVVSQVNNKIFSQRQLLVVGMFALMLARFFLIALFSK